MPTFRPRSEVFTRASDQPVTQSKWYRWRNDGTALVKYLLASEVHTFAFSVAANAILSFIPFIVMLYALAFMVTRVTGSMALVTAVTDVVHFLAPSNQDFIAAHLFKAAPHHGVQILSLIMILVACTGIFLPLEVALNQAWGVTKSRNYISNQIVAFGLAILMVILGMAGIYAIAIGHAMLADILPGGVNDDFFGFCYQALLALVMTITASIFIFAIFWLLPNRRIEPLPVLRTACLTGILWVLARYPFVAFLPHMDLQSLYGPFSVSVGLIFWSYTSGLILFAGAQFSVARLAPPEK